MPFYHTLVGIVWIYFIFTYMYLCRCQRTFSHMCHCEITFFSYFIISIVILLIFVQFIRLLRPGRIAIHVIQAEQEWLKLVFMRRSK